MWIEFDCALSLQCSVFFVPLLDGFAVAVIFEYCLCGLQYYYNDNLRKNFTSKFKIPSWKWGSESCFGSRMEMDLEVVSIWLFTTSHQVKKRQAIILCYCTLAMNHIFYWPYQKIREYLELGLSKHTLTCRRMWSM